MSMKAMQKDLQRFIPKTGFNLVGLDDFEKPGEQLYLINSYGSRAEAEKAMKAYGQKTDDKLFIYSPDNA